METKNKFMIDLMSLDMVSNELTGVAPCLSNSMLTILFISFLDVPKGQRSSESSTLARITKFFVFGIIIQFKATQYVVMRN